MDNWKVWDKDLDYGERFYRRAVGKLPEMESSKALSKILKKHVGEGSKLLDVGCGAGHYLKSISSVLKVNFEYTGVDATKKYIDLARDAWRGHKGVHFEVADIFKLPFEDKHFEIVFCSNVLLHLPSIEKPISELIRVSKKLVLIRTLISDRSFRIQDIHSPELNPESFEKPLEASEFQKDGTPTRFHFYNIYSKNYVTKLIEKYPDQVKIDISSDDDFDPDAITRDFNQFESTDQSYVIKNKQFNGCIMQPWHFILIHKQ